LLLSRIRLSYGAQRTILLVWDNWGVHYQEKVAAKATELGIGLLWLPTYAPWTNPIEKMWRRLKQQHLNSICITTRWLPTLALSRRGYANS
jgi:putative transposase